MAVLSPSALVSEPEPAAAATWDLSWIEALKGKHKQVFDFGGMTWENRDVVGGDTPLRVPRNWLNAHKEVYGLESHQLSTLIGIASSGFPINANDAVWQKYTLGERWKIMDSSTGKWAVRNLFSSPAAQYTDRLSTVEALKQRGTIFWQCNNALNGIVQMLAPSLKMNPDEVRKELVEGLMPGVKIVPAHTFALGLVQEKGCTYEKI